MTMNKLFTLMFSAALALALAGCQEQERADINLDPVAIHSGDECHVCGMIIVEWAGPKAESINKHNGETLKFCSTTDLFAWWLQPENKTLQAQIYVHDMSVAHWDRPQDEHLVEARDAWYVTGTDLIGAMGPTLVSFADKAAAQKLVDEKGGRILTFDEVDLAVLQEIGQAGHEYAASHGRELRRAMGVDDEEEQEADDKD